MHRIVKKAPLQVIKENLKKIILFLIRFERIIKSSFKKQFSFWSICKKLCKWRYNWCVFKQKQPQKKRLIDQIRFVSVLPTI